MAMILCIYFIQLLHQAYKDLEGVQKGSEAMNAFSIMSKLEDTQKEKMRNALLAIVS